MPWYFILSSATSTVAMYFWNRSKKNADDICYLSASIFVVSILISIIIAPLLLKCLLLGAVLFMNVPLNVPKPSKIVSAPKQTPVVSVPSSASLLPEPEKKVKLIYRGVTYEKTVS
jgi:hypothetical protein